ncbi:zinc finger protein 532 isoform X4 [Scomber japonicus]|uniref:zinc finger protein 532 isoform X4 n=1 Tax=Scomber japonicus TaxID=13676 RepID=UPI002304FE93|nr:zinc finger protein 532 isoform X4 [Scomber japonicus]
MGDMKTPDFDDLLAAFDIPDMVDPKAAIESGHHDDHDSQLKQPSGGVTTNEDDAHNSSTGHDVGVSVIVKNIRNMDTSEHGVTTSEKDVHFHSHPHPHSVSIGNGPHNSFLPTLPAGTHYKKNGWTAPREDGHPVTNSASTLNQFSPISSAEEFDDDDKIEVDDPVEKQGSQAYFRSTTKKEEQNPKSPVSLDNISKPTANGDLKPDQNNNNATLGGSKFNSTAQSSLPEEEPKEIVLKSQSQGCKEAGEPSGVGNVCSISQIKTKSSAKLSSCIAAIAALSAKKASATDLDSPTTQKEFIQANENPKAPEKPQEQESALEFAKRLLSRQPDSPSSVTSEGDTSKGSPASSTDTTPVIPKVRIKTIKTSTGQIKRTVTRVLPEFDLEGLKRGDSSNSTSVLATTSAIFSSPTRSSLPTTVVATSRGPSIEITKQMTIKPVATAFLPVSAVKTAGSKVINLKLANNTTVKATVIPAASVQSASSAILKAANAIQQQTVMVPASSLANAKLVSKTVHLSNLNLLPQTVSSAACDLQRALSSSKQFQHQQSQQHKILAGQPSKKVSRVQVFTSSQSSVVDAFNKVLSSINPVPVYVPNLSPPTSACISLPSRGYKCLECGDAFALEKSLTQHYERRSVRIEVTCNHCAKSLVFYNKCSLLSHARGHKDKGVVMQCSHLILKPIPADQMITTSSGPPSITTTTTTTTSTSQAQAPAGQIPGKVAGGGSQTTVISAPCSAPHVAAMPLEDDASKLCRHSLKCLECNEMFQDDNSLAMHYQQAPESNGQILKKHPCRQCDKSFSSSHSLCRHNRLKHKGLRKVYTCPHCPALSQPFTKRVLLDQHIQLMHGVKDPEGKTANSDNMDVSPAKETTLSPKRKPQEDEGSPGLHSRGSDSQPLKRLKVNILKVHKCAVCGFTTEDIGAFHKHIPQHKSDGSSYQCQECGFCYTSHRSLARHLFIVHRLKEPQALTRYNGRGKDDDESQRENQLDVTDENDDGTPNTKCKVCGKFFETEGNLNTHMRTHGMAFIKSKRLSAAEK